MKPDKYGVIDNRTCIDLWFKSIDTSIKKMNIFIYLKKWIADILVQEILLIILLAAFALKFMRYFWLTGVESFLLFLSFLFEFLFKPESLGSFFIIIN